MRIENVNHITEKEKIMKKAIEYEIINHGYTYYFQGCGTSFTYFDVCFTGCGDNAKEAYEDAIEQAYMSDINSDSLDKIMPKRPRGIRKIDKVPYRLFGEVIEDVYWYVSIRIKLV